MKKLEENINSTTDLAVEMTKLKAITKSLYCQKDKAYKERNQCVAAIANLANALGFEVYRGLHSVEDLEWEDDWRNIIFIEFPRGQCSWHFHDAELPLFEHFEFRENALWDGHKTDEKYERLAGLKENTPPKFLKMFDKIHPRNVDRMFYAGYLQGSYYRIENEGE